MIITQAKPIDEILKYLEGETKIFVVGCGECATTCKTGGECEVKLMLDELQKNGKTVVGWAVPESPCIAAQVVSNFAKHIKEIKEADSILVLACGLGVQTIKNNLRFDKPVHPALDTTFMGAVDKAGNIYEYCSACSECVLDWSGCICPVTRCPKNLLNGPCGGPKDGKCEVDREKDCAWILIYKELKRVNKLDNMKVIRQPKDWSKTTKPHQVILVKESAPV